MHAPNRNHTFIVKILVVYTPSAEYAHQYIFVPEQVIPLFFSDPKSFAGIPRNVHIFELRTLNIPFEGDAYYIFILNYYMSLLLYPNSKVSY